MENNDGAILEHDGSKVLTLSGEKIFVVIKQHFTTVLPSVILIILLTWFFVVLAVAGSVIYSALIWVFGLTILVITATGVGLLAQTFVNWYFHIYIITSRKLLEIQYSPMSGHLSNEILLDQVKCTEVDMRTDGVIHQFLDIGDVSMTFDRPTHQQEFTISSIKNYRAIGTLLANKLVRQNVSFSPQEKPQEIWFKERENSGKYNFTEEFPNAHS